MLGRLQLGIQFGRVTAVRRGEGTVRGDARQWIADIACAEGNDAKACLVVGDRVPLVHTEARPSWALVAYLAGNLYDPVCWPIPWMGAPEGDLPGHERLDEYGALGITIANDGTYEIATRPDGDPRLRITPDGAGGEPTVEMLGGPTRMAREGDFVRLTPATSPFFFAWAASVGTALTALGRGEVATAFAAMKDAVAGEGPPASQQAVAQIATGSDQVKGK